MAKNAGPLLFKGTIVSVEAVNFNSCVASKYLSAYDTVWVVTAESCGPIGPWSPFSPDIPLGILKFNMTSLFVPTFVTMVFVFGSPVSVIPISPLSPFWPIATSSPFIPCWPISPLGTIEPWI